MGKIIELDTWIASDDTPAIVKIRDEGAEAIEAVLDEDGNLALNEDGTPVQEAVPARGAWPVDHYVHIKALPMSGDQVLAKRLSVLGQFKIGPGQKNDAELAWYLGSLVACAVMIVGFEGSKFTNPSTGAVLDFEDCKDGDELKAAQKRLAKLQKKVPGPITNFVGEELERRGSDPLGLAPKSKASEKPTA